MTKQTQAKTDAERTAEARQAAGTSTDGKQQAAAQTELAKQAAARDADVQFERNTTVTTPTGIQQTMPADPELRVETVRRWINQNRDSLALFLQQEGDAVDGTDADRKIEQFVSSIASR